MTPGAGLLIGAMGGSCGGGRRAGGGGGVKYLRHQGIYGYRRQVLLDFVRWKPTPLEQAEKLEQLRALEHGVAIGVIIVKRGSVGVDAPEDVATAERALRGR